MSPPGSGHFDGPKGITSASLCRLSYSGLYSYELGLCSWPRLAYMVRGPALETIGNKAAVKGDTEQRGG